MGGWGWADGWTIDISSSRLESWTTCETAHILRLHVMGGTREARARSIQTVSLAFQSETQEVWEFTLIIAISVFTIIHNPSINHLVDH